MAAGSLASPFERGAALARSGPGIGPLVVLVAVVATPIGLAIMLDGSSYDTWGAFIWAPVMLALALPLCRWVAAKTGEPEIAGFLFGAAALKIVIGAGLRYYMVDAVYGAGDAFGYDRAAAELTDQFQVGEFGGLGKVTGTRFLEIVNGLVQTVIGQTMVGSFLVFSALGFLGMCFLYLAFCEAHPTGDRQLYRRLLFLTPTIWFWPSSVGKEAFLILSVGAFAYGFALLLSGRARGAVLGALGLWGAAVVRPHIALMLIVGAVVAVPQGPRPLAEASADTARRRVGRYVLPLLIVLAIPASLSTAETFFQIDGLNLESATEVRDEVVRRTSSGGSEFAAPDTGTPLGMVAAVVAVVARPFPWEGSGFQALASAELVVLGGIASVAMWRRRRGLLRTLAMRWPRFSIVYIIAFAWGFSAVSNFGILARQRSLMLPFLFVLVAAVARPVSDDAEPYVPTAAVTR